MKGILQAESEIFTEENRRKYKPDNLFLLTSARLSRFTTIFKISGNKESHSN